VTAATRRSRLGRLRLPTLCLITDRERCGKTSLETVVEGAVKAGANVVQLREKDLPAGELFALAGRLRTVTRGRALLLVNDRIDVAMACGADGVHLPEDGLPVGMARWLLGKHALIGCSVHSVEAAVQAERNGADFVQVGTIFATDSKPEAQPVGAKLVDEVAKVVSIPVLAVGGVKAKNVAEVIAAGASGASVISAICGAREPEKATDELVKAMAEAWSAGAAEATPA
jgi:thiamine-phosphate pyrophosphorylase